MKKIVYIIAAMLLCITIKAQKMTVEQVHNPQLDSRETFVSDVVGVLSTGARETLNTKCAQIEKELGVEIAIVVVPGIEGDDEYGFAYDLFNLWKIGKEGKNNGLLWLYAVDIRAMKFETGLGLEGLLPDAFLNGVLDETIFPLMREQKTDEAFNAGLDAITAKLTTTAAREELLLNTESPKVIGGDILAIYLTAAILVLLFLLYYFYHLTQRLKGENNIKYFRVKPVVDASKVLMFIFPIPILLFWLYVRNYQKGLRNKTLICDHCGGTMKLLTEEEEDQYLSFKQQAEEKVKSVDYDVWKCNVCDNVKILKYESMSTKYKCCPQCGAKTYTLVADNILEPATTLRAGRGEKVHECANCKLRRVVPYVIPIIVVASGKGHGSGGSFGGGGFGGGISGGGGAGGRF